MGKTYYILYQVTNNLNGKIYVGVHKTKKLDDGYMGSGKVITSAIAKYGVENFTRVILEQFDDSAAMFAREKEVVTDEFLLREDTYNLRRGGFGGFDYINRSGLAEVGLRNRNDESMKKMIDAGRRGAQKKISKYGYPGFTTESNLKGMQTKKEKYGELFNSWHIGAKRSTATRQKLSIRSSGEHNSQFGSIWITNGTTNKKIKKDDPVPEGWRAGRVLISR